MTHLSTIMTAQAELDQELVIRKRTKVGGGIWLTPLYDAMPVQPLYNRDQLRRSQMKMAVAFANNSHFRVDGITALHFDETAKLLAFPAD